MAIYYETGVASSPSDLLGKFATFIGGHGWGQQNPATSNAYVFNNGSEIVAGVAATVNSWDTRGCLSYDELAEFDAQPGNSGMTHIMNLGNGPFTAYHFYVGDEDGVPYAHASVEVLPNQFRHWAIGQLVKSGAVTGAVYTDSTYLENTNSFMNSPEFSGHRYLCDASATPPYSVGHLRVDYDSKTNNWQAVSNVAFGVGFSDACLGSTRQSGLFGDPQAVGYQRWNLRTPLWPMIYFANRASSLRSPIGRMPNLRQINVRNFTPGELITIGGDQWQVFPVFQKQIGEVALDVVSSGLHGYAHRR